MSGVSLVQKIDMLDQDGQEKVSDFIDFLLSRQSDSPQRNRESLLQTSVWSEDDIQVIEEAGQEWAKWPNPQSF